MSFYRTTIVFRSLLGPPLLPFPPIASRDLLHGRDEMGIHFVHVAPLSHVSRFTRYGSTMLADLFSILLKEAVSLTV